MWFGVVPAGEDHSCPCFAYSSVKRGRELRSHWLTEVPLTVLTTGAASTTLASTLSNLLLELEMWHAT